MTDPSANRGSAHAEPLPPPNPGWDRVRVPADAPQPLLLETFLIQGCGLSGRRVRRLLHSSGVRVRGRRVHSRARLRPGDEVEFRRIDGSRPAAPPSAPSPGTAVLRQDPTGVPGAAAIRIVLETEEVRVIDKPAGMAVHPGPGTAPGTPTLVDALRDWNLRHGLHEGIHAVHRLDRGTSGLLLVARSPAAHARMDRALRDGAIERRYLALVHGIPAGESGSIRAPIGTDPRRPRLRKIDPRGAAATTHWRVLASGADRSLLEIVLETGRTHQIRVHLAHLGHPLLGDREYGGGRPPGAGPSAPESFPLKRPALHAYRLGFPARDGSVLRASSPLPRDLRALLPPGVFPRLLPGDPSPVPDPPGISLPSGGGS